MVNIIELVATSIGFIPIIIVIFFIYQGKKVNRNTPHLTLAFIFAIFPAFILLTGLEPLLHVFGPISLFFYYLHYEAVSSEQPNPYLFSFQLFLVSISIGYTILILAEVLVIDPTSILLSGIIHIVIMIITWMKAENTVRHSRSLLKDRPLNIEYTAIVVFLIGAAISLFYCVYLSFNPDVLSGDISPVPNYPIYFMPLFPAFLPGFIGFLMFLINYFMHPRYIYKLPFPVHSIMIYNSVGLPAYSRKVQTRFHSAEFEEVLISGAFRAISALISETLGSEAHLRRIDAITYRIYFSELPSNAGTLAFISSKGSYFFQKSLDQFGNEIPPNILDEINSSNLELQNLAKQIDKLVVEIFPYMDLEAEN